MRAMADWKPQRVGLGDSRFAHVCVAHRSVSPSAPAART